MILVSDTSVLIDLDRGGLLEALFALPHAFAVPDVLYQAEMADEWGGRLLTLGLRVEEVSAEGVKRAINYRRQQARLSISDSFALALAKERKWVLLTADRDLRALATEEAVDCHGVLWLLDAMEETECAPIQLLCNGLKAISGHHRCRLPKAEIALRLDRYQISIAKLQTY